MAIEIPLPTAEDAVLAAAYVAAALLAAAATFWRDERRAATAALVMAAVGGGLMAAAPSSPEQPHLPKFTGSPYRHKDMDAALYEKQFAAWERETKLTAEIRGAAPVAAPQIPADRGRSAAALAVLLGAAAVFAPRAIAAIYRAS